MIRVFSINFNLNKNMLNVFKDILKDIKDKGLSNNNRLYISFFTNQNIELPNSNTNWKVEGNNKLTPGNPVTLVWNNNQGISFKKK